MSLPEMNAKLLRKVEEPTPRIIEQENHHLIIVAENAISAVIVFGAVKAEKISYKTDGTM